MAFDKEKFIAAAKAAKFTDDEINAELNTTPAPTSAPVGGAAVPAMPATSETFSDSQAKAKADYDAKVHKALTASVTVGDHTYEIPSFFTSPAGIITAAGAGIGLASTLMGAAKVAPKAYNAIKDRWISKAPAIDRNVDIPFQGPTATLDAKVTTPTPVVSNVPTPTPASEWDDLIARSERNKADKAAYAAARAGMPVVEAPVVGSAPSGASAAPIEPIVQRNKFDPSRIGQPLQDPLAGGGFQTPVQEIGPRPPPTAVDTLAAGGTPTQIATQTAAQEIDAIAPVAPPEELRTGTGKPAFAGQGPAAEIRTKGKKAGEPMLRNSYAKVEDVPAGYAFVPGAQNIDTSRTNIGQVEYTKAYANRPFPLTNELAVQESNEINRMLGRPTRLEAKAAGITLPPQTPGITKHVLESRETPFLGTKAAKVGGILGALIAIPDLVNAKTAEQKASAGVNLLGAVLPPGMDINAAGAPSVQQSQVSNAALLGSPYAQTEWAKAQRLRERAGAGRGIAPPSSYLR